MEFLHCLVIIYPYGTELLIQFSKTGNVFKCRSVGTDYPKFFGKDTGGNELCLGLQAGLLEKCEETGVFHRIEIDGVAENGRIALRLPATFFLQRRLTVFFFFIHNSWIFSGTIADRRSNYALPLSPNNYRLRR